MSLGKNTRLDDVGRNMLSSPLDITHDRRMSGVACLHVPWAAHMVDDVRRGMPSSSFDSIHG